MQQRQIRKVNNSATSIHEGYAGVLAELFPGNTILHVERLTGGVSADVYRLDLLRHDDSRFPVVLRVHGASHSGHSAELEFRLLTALYDRGVAVPEPLLVDTSGERVPEPFLIMSFIEGTTHIPANEVRRHVKIMAETLAHIHTLPLAGLPDLPTRDEPWPELLEYLPDGSEWQTLGEQLAVLQPPRLDSPPQLLHGDFWPENLLWRNGRISAVLDWEDSAVGDHHADVAAARVELRYLFGREIMEQFSEAYARHQPIDHTRLLLWQIYVAAAAQKYMGQWGLPSAREAHMRTEALASIREAADELLRS